MKKICILGSTGSIGTQTLNVIRDCKGFEVIALAAKGNIRLLKEQVEEFHPKVVAVWEEEKAKELKEQLGQKGTEVLYGMEGLLAVATEGSVDIVVASVVGMIGIRPIIAAIKAKKTIALANKETLVTAGHLIMPLAKQMKTPILPVDSEHSAIFQCLKDRENKPEKILLTASGGPFRGKKREELIRVQAKDALMHPNWSMGKKITIDSATMVNKGLEVIEAKWLFDIDVDKIQVVIQPQSIIHSMVELKDGAVIAQLGAPDMYVPISYALYYPERKEGNGKRLDFYELTQITFEKPDFDTFLGLRLAYEAAREGGSLPTVLNAANERAVSLFLKGKIKFLEIAELIQFAMEHHTVIQNPSLEEILEVEKWTYDLIESRRK